MDFSQFTDEKYKVGRSFRPNPHVFDVWTGVYFVGAFVWLIVLILNVSILWWRKPKTGPIDAETSEYQSIRKKAATRDLVIKGHSESEREFLSSRRQQPKIMKSSRQLTASVKTSEKTKDKSVVSTNSNKI